MKRFNYAKSVYMIVVLVVVALALITTAVFRLLHVLGAGNMVSFYPIVDVVLIVIFLGVAVLALFALFGAGYYFGKSLRVVLGVPVFTVQYDKIKRVIKAKDGSLWLIVEDGPKEARLKICLAEIDEASFVSSIREHKRDVTYETEI